MPENIKVPCGNYVWRLAIQKCVILNLQKKYSAAYICCELLAVNKCTLIEV